MADKLAEYVAKNGRSYEDMTRQRNSASSPFGWVAGPAGFCLLQDLMVLAWLHGCIEPHASPQRWPHCALLHALMQVLARQVEPRVCLL